MANDRQLRRGIFVLTLLPVILMGCGKEMQTTSSDRQSLFNGQDLSGWTMVSQDRTVPVSQVWSVRDGVLHCAGAPNGYLRTTEIYQNYHLHLEWRWVETPANSGVLLHCQSPDRVWPQCIECQLMAGNAGDFVLLGGTGLTVDGTRHQDADQPYIIIAKKTESNEKSQGQWNTYDIYSTKDGIRCRVNGVLQNEGMDPTVTSGMIGLQSEGGPIEFRNIYLKAIP